MKKLSTPPFDEVDNYFAINLENYFKAIFISLPQILRYHAARIFCCKIKFI